jgi:hypothetical protein
VSSLIFRSLFHTHPKNCLPVLLTADSQDLQHAIANPQKLLQDLQDSSEEEEEGQDEYDLDDKFLVGDEDEEDEDGEEEGTEEEKKRRRRKKRKEAQLDEEDYELIVRPSTILSCYATSCAMHCTKKASEKMS